ncbi:MAG: c-type cytochrome [Nitrospirota bacterium]|nr:c-type cytochrome [Nitrospirota bacterium]
MAPAADEEGGKPASGPRLKEGEEAPLDQPKQLADIMELPAPRDWRAMINPVPADGASVARGQGLYLGKGMCHLCHGQEGDSFSPIRNEFKPPPNDFFEEQWHASRTDGQLMEALQMGKPGTGMVPFIPDYLTEAEGWDVINFLRSLKGGTSKAYEAYQEYLQKQEEERQRLIQEAGG